MASNLHSKITSYTLRRGIEFNDATPTTTTTPTRTGTSPLGTGTFTSTVYSSNGPLGGAGSWVITANATTASLSSALRWANSVQNNEAQAYADGDYSMGFWFKVNTFPATSSAASHTLHNSNGTGVGISVRLSGTNYTAAPRSIQIISGNTVYQSASNIVTAGQWNYFAARRVSGGNTAVYLNGSLLTTLTSTSLTASGTLVFGDQAVAIAGTPQFQISNYYVTDSSIIDATAISEIWTVGTTNPAVNVSYSPAIVTASATMVDPVETVSHNADPATASAESSYLAVSGEVNYLDTQSTATVLLVNPTLVITSPDHTEVVTSISVSAEMVNPSSVVAVINITNSSDTMTATAEMDNHTVISGATLEYSAELVGVGIGEMLEPSHFGPDDYTHIAQFATATATFVNPQVLIQANYYNYVKRNSPIYYLRDFSGGNTTLLNEGSLNYGALDKGPVGSTSWSLTTAASGLPMSLIDNGTSLSSNGAGTAYRWRYTDRTAYSAALASMYSSKNWTYEFWHKPSNINTNSANNSQFWYQDNAFSFKLNYTPTAILTDIYLNDGVQSPQYTVTTSSSLMTNQNWHHIAIRSEYLTATTQRLNLYIDTNIVYSQIFTITGSYANYYSRLSGSGNIDWLHYGTASTSMLDEIAVYPSTLTNNEIVEHYSFVNSASPDRNIFATRITASAEFVDPVISLVSNKNFPATPITGSTLFVNPSIITQVYKTIAATPITASSRSVNPSFYGTPDYNKLAEVLTVYAEFGNNTFTLDDTYSSFVQTNITPYRYVTFDTTDSLEDVGTDTQYSVIKTSIGGEITLPSYGINNKSVLTDGTSYLTSGVVLYESEYNDTWGTDLDRYSSSFWMQRSSNDTSGSNPRVIFNAYSAYTQDYVLIYQWQGKLHLELSNGSLTTQSGTSTVDLFDYNRHHVLIDFDHTGGNHYIKIYIDSILKETFNVQTRTISLINGITSVGPNDEANNYPRLGIGCLIMPFGDTSLPNEPTTTTIYIDEIYWAKTGITQTGVTNLYNAMPAKTNKTWFADFFIGSNANIPNPIIRAGNTRLATSLTASANMVQPQLYLVYNRIIDVYPATGSAEIVQPGVTADDVREVNFVAEYMYASILLTEPTVGMTIRGTTLTATAKMPNSPSPYLDEYILLVISETKNQSFASSFRNGYALGDIDS